MFNDHGDQQADDTSDRGNHGTLANDPTWTPSGKFGYALDFDGTNDYVSVPDDASLDITDQITMEAWVKPTGGASNYWNYKKQITIDHTRVQATETNFPVLISVTDTDLKDTGNGGPVQPDGDDIMFTLTDGTKLSHEIELYTGSTGNLIAWVKIPSLSHTADTKLYMYYGNSDCTSQQDATNVWDTNYKGVWHLLGDGTTALPEATSNSNTGTKQAIGEPANTASGQIDGAQDFELCENGVCGWRDGLRSALGWKRQVDRDL
ncbi:DUF2341 domain-containing protein [candidate division NPL-UPA2 bacterium]|nr:DUF2341 domain-containing protein [candidate division NPL-UPA2 bacterium]